MAHNSIALPVPPRHTGKRISMRVIRAMVNHIAGNFDPEQIVLFGSYAYGKPEQWSDIDLLVVKDIPEGTEIESALEISLSLPEHYLALDILVRSRAVIEKRLAIGDRFMKEIVTRGKRLYARQDGRMDS